MQIQFGVRASDSDSRAVSSQLALNCFVQAQKGGKSKFTVRGGPGIVLFSTLSTGPVRGMIAMGDNLYAVSGQVCYKIDINGTPTSLGTVTGVDLVTMAENGSQVAIAADGKGYIATSSTLAEISDSDFTGRYPIGTVDHVDGYFVWNTRDSDIWFLSDLNDGTSYDAADQATAESESDAIVRVLADAGQIWFFGRKTTEVWVNTGASPFPFERVNSATIPEGLFGANTPVKLDNTVFWVNDDRIVQKFDVRPIRVSDSDVEADLEAVTDESKLEAWGYVQKGHAFYVLSHTDWTWVFDASTNEWHKRQTGSSPGRWNASGISSEPAKVFGKWLVGDPTQGRIGYLDTSVYTEYSSTIINRVRSETVHGYPNNMLMNRLSLDFEMGVGLTSGQGSDPVIMFRYSDDNGHTWSLERQYEIGAKGEYMRQVHINGLPMISPTGRIFEITMSDPVPFVLISADLNNGPQ